MGRGAQLAHRARRLGRRAAERFAGLPRPTGPVDTPPPDVAHDITRLWLRNSRPFGAPALTDPDGEAVVTMTTHGARIRDVWVALESVGRGTVRPSRLILWLDAPTRLPRRLRRMVRRGLEVRETEPGNGVHTKYWPYLQSTASTVPLALADDDIVYPPSWLEALLTAHRESPELVVAYRAHLIELDGEDLAPYAGWRSCDDDSASFAHFATSVSGQILPAALQQALRAEGTQFRDAAPTADDVWLHRTAVLAGIRTRQVLPGQRHWWFVPGSQGTGLNAVNVVGGGNDRQLRATHTPTTMARIRADLAAEQGTADNEV